MSRRRHLENTAVDSGYSWIVLFASSGIYTIVAGNAKAYGILYTEFLRYYGTGSGSTAWIGSVHSFLFFALGPVSNRLSEAFSFRLVIFCGGLLYGIGMFASAFVQQMELLYLTIGLMAGVGGGLVFAPASTIVSFYFEKRRALANAIVISGSGIGSFLFPYLYRHVIDQYGIHGALMILGGVIANICVFALLFRQPPQLVQQKELNPVCDKDSKFITDIQDGNTENEIQNDTIPDREEKEQNESTKKPTISISDLFDFSLFRNPSFVMYALAYTANTFAYIANYSVMPTKILALGYSKDKVAVALSIAGVTEIFSKLCFGWLVDLKLFPVKHLLLLTFVVSGIAAMIIPVFEDFAAFAVYAGIVGVFPGSYFTLMAVVLLQCIKLTELARGFGLTTLCMSFGAVLSQPIAGWIEDATGTWDHSFRFIGAMNLLATIIVLGEPLFVKYWPYKVKPQKKKNETEPEMTSDLKETGTLDRRYSLELVSQPEQEYNTSL